MDQQTKAKLMELFSEALDKKAHIDIHFSHYETDEFVPVFKNDVEEKVKDLAETLAVRVEEIIKDSFHIRTDNVRLCFSYVPPENEYLEEDIWQEEDAV
ncbi:MULTISPECIES: hypothetical protein [Peribacillus]|uniref:hypothetical protein n=1 Tax=Peribacillus TaxID=2675229 RepID=UPI001F4DBEBA|nr:MULTISPECIES: hypothetical protein [unclassified Peribacillus]MCK1982182.1 hypothetical protein [Peribacillus sp. Aquil_B1]MCK2007466.1 hypothetical protein [Peribacillus sp. Aquil_B8]